MVHMPWAVSRARARVTSLVAFPGLRHLFPLTLRWFQACSSRSGRVAKRRRWSHCVPSHRAISLIGGSSVDPPSVAAFLQPLEVENERTARYLRSNIDTGDHKYLYQALQDEILLASTINEAAINSDGDSLGPTGRYRYRWDVPTSGKSAIPSKRIYQRCSTNNGPLDECEVVLENDWATDRLSDMSLSIDERAIAYLVQRNAAAMRAMVRIIATGQQIELVIEPTNLVSIEFGSMQDGSHALFVVQADAVDRSKAVYSGCFKLDSLASAAKDGRYALFMTCLYQSNDPTEHVDIHRTKGLDYIAINSRTQSTNETYLVTHGGQPQLVRQREHGVMYHVEVGSSQDVFLLSNGDSCGTDPAIARNDELALFQTSACNLPLRQTLGQSLTNTYPKDTILTDFDIFHDYIVVYERSTKDGSHRVSVTLRRSSCSDSPHERVVLPLPTDAAMVLPAGNMYYRSTILHCSVESPLAPRRLLQFDLTGLNSAANGTPSAQFSTDSNHVQKRLFVTSQDGTIVPLSLFYKADAVATLPSNVPVHIILTGYGAYGAPVSLAYDPTMQPLLDRGCVLAFAHTRGGGERGRAWHDQARGVRKNRAVEDYLACAEFIRSDHLPNVLLNQSTPLQLTAKGRSAGGIVIGAAVNQRPHLFDKVVLSSAFLDLDATMRQPSRHLTQHEWDEYGNPLVDDAAAHAIASICPVVNVPERTEASDAPQFLLVAAMDDRSVPVENTLVYGRKLREKFGAKVYFHLEREGGHEMDVNRIRVAATEAAFILNDASE